MVFGILNWPFHNQSSNVFVDVPFDSTRLVSIYLSTKLKTKYVRLGDFYCTRQAQRIVNDYFGLGHSNIRIIIKALSGASFQQEATVACQLSRTVSFRQSCKVQGTLWKYSFDYQTPFRCLNFTYEVVIWHPVNCWFTKEIPILKGDKLERLTRLKPHVWALD